MRFLSALVIALVASHAAEAEEGRADSIAVWRPLPSQQTGGLLGERLDLWRTGRMPWMLDAEDDYLFSGFESHPGRHPWQGEHVGKWLHAATLAYEQTLDTKLFEAMQNVVERLLRAQEPGGYMGTYGPETRFTAMPENVSLKDVADDIAPQKKSVRPSRGWDTWTFRYNLYGLLTYERFHPDPRIVDACRRMADLLIEVYGEGKYDLTKYGSHQGISATTLLESIVMLYERTQDQKYLDFAEHIVAMSEAHQRLRLMEGYRGYAAPKDDSQIKDEIERLMTLAPQGTRPRVIVMTDGEVDDRSSMIRFLLYTCDFDVLAIIETNSIFQRNGHSDKNWIQAQLAAYEKVYPNLIKHHPGYPTADELRARHFVGDEDHDHLRGLINKRWELRPGAAITFKPDDWKDTPGSEKIVQVLLEENPAPVHIQAWGGGNTAARAFYKLKTEYPGDYQRAVSKVVMYNIWYQDGAGNYIQKYHPEVTMIYCGHFAGTWNYHSQPNTHDFITKYVKTGHGPLGALYPQTYISEGDSPAFFYVVDNGLRNHEHPGFGGWGGRFKKVEGFERVYIDAEDKGGSKYQLARWIDAANRDFQARMAWCVKDFKEANHPPVVKLAHAHDLKVRPGESVSLSAKGTTDPDGDEVVFHWWQYREAGSYDGSIEIRDAGKQDASFTVPHNVDTGETIHVICEVTDTGTPPLTRYQRVILEVKP